jgi:DNA-3-methyladenine glycosylase II
MHGLAAHFLDGGVNADAWPDMDDEAIIKQLTTVKGIGRWTAEMFLIFHLLRPDVMPVGDIGIQKAIGNHYAGGTRPGPKEMIAIAEKWRPWRSVAVWYLWRSLDAVPVEY